VRNIYDGISFIEGDASEFTKVKQLETTLGEGITASSQLMSLDDVKKNLAGRCKELDCDTLICFKYGQRSLGFFASIFSRDNVVWYGEGFAARKQGS
jgi:hypothetical protein